MESKEKNSKIDLITNEQGIVIKVTLYDQDRPGYKSYLESVYYSDMNHLLSSFIKDKIQWKVIYTWTKDSDFIE